MDVKTHNGQVTVTAGYKTVSISYSEIVVGEADKAVPVIACHGFALSKELLTTTFLKHLTREAATADLNLRIIALDWPGHGLSGELGKYSFEALREVLRAFMDKMGIVRAHIFGMSLGGSIAIMFAAKYPARVMTLCTVGAPIDSRDLDFGTGFRQAAAGFRVARVFSRFTRNKMKFVPEDVLRKLVSIVVSSGPPGAVKDFEAVLKDKNIYSISIRDLRRLSARAYIDYVNEFLKLDLFGELNDICSGNMEQVPVLVVDGEDPGYRFVDTLEEIYSMLDPEFTEKLIIKGTGHLSIVLKPEEAAAGYIEFLFRTYGRWKDANLRVV